MKNSFHNIYSMALFHPLKRKFPVHVIDFYAAAFGEFFFEDFDGQGVLDFLLDHAFQRAGAVGGVVALGGNGVKGGGSYFQLDAFFLELLFQTADLDFHDLADLFALKRMEDEDFVDAV